MRIAVFTWNAGQSLEKQDVLQLSQWLTGPSSKDATTRPDIYAIGLQEAIPLPQALAGLTHARCTPYERKLQQQMENNLNAHVSETNPGSRSEPPPYNLVGKVTIGALDLLVYANEDVAHRVESVLSATVGCGPLWMSNKGAVGLRLQLREPQETVTFVTAHLAAHDYNVLRRNLDWRSIVSRLVFHSTANDCSYQIYDSDHLYLFGDLNYRTSVPEPRDRHLLELKIMLDQKNYKLMIRKDQLNTERKNKRVFQGLQEGPIHFPPTYKYKPGTNTLTHYTKRVPSWCDRILHAHSSAMESVEQRLYQSLMDPNASDHKPVTAIYETQMKSERPKENRDNESPYFKDAFAGAKQIVGRIADRTVGHTWCGVAAIGLGNDKAGLLLLVIAVVTTVVLLRRT